MIFRRSPSRLALRLLLASALASGFEFASGLDPASAGSPGSQNNSSGSRTGTQSRHATPDNRSQYIQGQKVIGTPPGGRTGPQTPFPPTRGGERTATFNVVMKSYIAIIGDHTGAFSVSEVDDFGVTLQKLKAFAVATDLAFHEDPGDDRRVDGPTKGYRLFSQRQFTVTCRGPELISVQASALDSDVGKEGPYQPPPMRILVNQYWREAEYSVLFEWEGMAKPHPDVEVSFQVVRKRLSTYIWHKIRGRLFCTADGTPQVEIREFTGSRFPSHRVFVNGRVERTISQGAFVNLWYGKPADVTVVQ